MAKLLMLCAAASLLATCGAWAHSGGLDKNGCHHDRKNSGSHCHGGGASSQQAPQRAAASSFAPSNAAPARHQRDFANCAETRTSGTARVRRSDQGNGPHLDRDNDGLGCEPYLGRQ